MVAFLERELGGAHAIAGALPARARLGALASALVAVGGALEHAGLLVRRRGLRVPAEVLEQLRRLPRLARLDVAGRRALPLRGRLVQLARALQPARLAAARREQRVGRGRAQTRARVEPARALRIAEPGVQLGCALEVAGALEQLRGLALAAAREQRLACLAPQTRALEVVRRLGVSAELRVDARCQHRLLREHVRARELHLRAGALVHRTARSTLRRAGDVRRLSPPRPIRRRTSESARRRDGPRSASARPPRSQPIANCASAAIKSERDHGSSVGTRRATGVSAVSSPEAVCGAFASPRRMRCVLCVSFGGLI
jgi:hypothetical protein